MLFIVATLSFLLVHLLPGDPGRFVLGIYASAHQVHVIDQRLGYDRPLVAQYLTWLNHAVHGNLGTSIITHRSVSADLNARIPVTLSLAIGATILATVLGIVFGMVSAIRGGWVDRTVQGVAGLGLAIPNFWLAVLLVLVFSLSLKWLPAVGYVSYGQSIGEWARFLTLPYSQLVSAPLPALRDRPAAPCEMFCLATTSEPSPPPVFRGDRFCSNTRCATRPYRWWRTLASPSLG